MNTLVLQGYMVSKLSAWAPLQALIADRIYDRVPKAPQFPYVALGLAQGIDQSISDCAIDWEVIAQLDVWSREVGFPQSKEIARACDDALADRHPSISGIRVGFFEPRGQRHLRDPDGLTMHAVLEYRARYGPAT